MLGVYVHIPYCKKKCSYCSFVSFTHFSDMRDYIDALQTEIKSRAKGETTDTVYIGGGTPSILFHGAIKSVTDTIRSCFSVTKDAEITVEANPESVSEMFADECVMSGINRISLGLQSANDSELAVLGRLHNVRKFEWAYNLLRKKGFDNINIDLMLGLPLQTLQSLNESVNYTLSLKPEHISVYALTPEKGCKLFEKYFPDDDLSADMYESASETLIKNGYFRYEVSNFALDGKLSRHNFKYWTGEDYYGFGTAAHSFLNGIRYENPLNNKDYITHKSPKETILTRQDNIEEYIMLRLRLSKGLSLSEFRDKFDYDLCERKRDEIRFLTQSGFVNIRDGNLFLTDKGFYVMNQIIVRLL